jgi:hypothetical protein
METIIVLLIVALAGVYTFKTFFKSTQSADRCGCGCESCPAEAACDIKESDGVDR